MHQYDDERHRAEVVDDDAEDAIKSQLFGNAATVGDSEHKPESDRVKTNETRRNATVKTIVTRHGKN